MYQLYIDNEGQYGASISIPNVGTFYLIYGSNGGYAGAVNQSASATGSPLVIQFDSASVNLGDVYQAILAKLPNG